MFFVGLGLDAIRLFCYAGASNRMMFAFRTRALLLTERTTYRTWACKFSFVTTMSIRPSKP